MRLISHRGNLTGKDWDNENRPDRVRFVLSLGYDVEVDLWKVGNSLYLGHDNAQYLIYEDFLQLPDLWVHAKNLDALYHLSTMKEAPHYFWHQEDDFTMTSRGYIWTYPGKPLTENSVCVLPTSRVNSCYGVCVDNIAEYHD